MRQQSLKWYTTQERMPDPGPRIVWVTKVGEMFVGTFVGAPIFDPYVFAYEFDELGNLRFHNIVDIREWSYI